MKAVIMAGGKGTRLRPLTCNIPKPMVPILNIPVMEYIIRLLKKMDIVEIAVTAFYLPETIKDYFGDGEKWGVSLKYFLEESPLGTAGSVHNADDFLDETFLVISGDAMSDFNVQKAVDFHMENGADATIILSQENIPLDYGVIMVDEKKKIIRFLEKPAWSQVFSDTINTGIYILEPEIFNIFPKNKKYDFSKDLFPLMLKNNRDLYGLPLNGYWNDIGSLEEYRQTNFDLIEGLINLDINKDYSKIDENIYIENNVNIDDSAILKGPLYISEGSEIAQGVYLESSVIGKNARILSYSSVKKSVLWNNIYLDSRTEIRGATIADNVIIKDGVEIYEKSIIGRKVKVGRKSVIKPGVKIWPEKLIEDESDVNDSLIWSSGWKRKLFTNLGIVGISNVDITPEYLARLASAYAAVLKPGDELIISSDTYEISKSLSRAFISGLQSSGVNVLDIGNSITPVVRYSIMKFSAAGGVFIHVSQKNNTRIIIEFFDKNGINLSSSQQRSIEKKYFVEDYRRMLPEKTGKFSYAPDMNNSYLDNLLSNIDFESIKKNNFKLVLDFEYDNLINLLPVFLNRLNCDILLTKNYSDDGLPLSFDNRLNSSKKVIRILKENKCDLGIIFDHNAEQLRLFTNEGNIIDKPGLQVLISYLLLERGVKKLYLPLNVPRVIEKMTQEYGAEVIFTPINKQATMGRYFDYLKKESDMTLPYFYPYLDGICALALILERISLDKKDVNDLLDELPNFYLQKTDVSCNWEDKGKIMRILSSDSKKKELIDGIRFSHRHGWALVIPDSEQPGFHIYAEGKDQETAESLTGFYTKKLKKILNK